MPVNTMVMPCSLAAAMTSSSRLLPPGCTMALMPYLAAASMPSRNGKNASDAMALPSTSRPSSLALSAATWVEYTRDICPAPTPMVMPSRANTMAFDLTYLHTRQANHRSAYCVGVGFFWVTILNVAGSASAVSRVWTRRPPLTLRYSNSEVERVASGPTTSTRTFCRLASTAPASADTEGATITSTNWRPTMAVAVAASSSRLKAMMPPNAEVGSVR